MLRSGGGRRKELRVDVKKMDESRGNRPEYGWGLSEANEAEGERLRKPFIGRILRAR